MSIGHRRILALDWGERRVGLAVADEDGWLVSPRGFVDRKPGEAEVERQLRALIADEDIELLVLGLPLNMDGTRGTSAEKSDEFAAWLERTLGLPVERVDERLSSYAAEQRMQDLELNRRQRARHKDEEAAVWILESWLETHNPPIADGNQDEEG